jgi:hypothetical protein
MSSRIAGRRALFAKLQDPRSQPEFWAHVADDVDWTVEGTHPLAGRYRDKATFIDATSNRLAGILPAGVKRRNGPTVHEPPCTRAQLAPTESREVTMTGSHGDRRASRGARGAGGRA